MSIGVLFCSCHCLFLLLFLGRVGAVIMNCGYVFGWWCLRFFLVVFGLWGYFAFVLSQRVCACEFACIGGSAS